MYVYIYAYIYRERERKRDDSLCCTSETNTHLALLGVCFVWVFIAFLLSGRQDVPGSICRFLIPDRGFLKIKKKEAEYRQQQPHFLFPRSPCIPFNSVTLQGRPAISQIRERKQRGCESAWGALLSLPLCHVSANLLIHFKVVESMRPFVNTASFPYYLFLTL